MSLFLALTLALAAAPSPCPAGTAVVMACAAKKKHIAVCIDAGARPAGVQYRFGPLATLTTKPELAVPARADEGFARFRLEERTLLSGSATSLTFNNGDVTYEVYTQDGKDGGGGVNVVQGGKMLANIPCTDDVVAHWDRLEPHVRAAAATPATSGGPKPDPTAGKSPKEICNDDVLLLTKYSWDDLRMNGAFKKHCCVKGALGTSDERCDLDWPSSDMPECDFFDELRNGLFARYGYVFQDPKWQQVFAGKDWYRPRTDFTTAWMPKVATDNVAVLKVFACPKPVAPEMCDKAGLQWSRQLQKAAKGQMDGVQQNDIADGLARLCKTSGWKDQAVDCFVQNQNRCDAKLIGEHVLQAEQLIRGICPDALP